MTSHFSALDESRPLQHSEMLREVGTGDAKLLLQVLSFALADSKKLYNVQTNLMPERVAQDVTDLVGIVAHPHPTKVIAEPHLCGPAVDDADSC